MYFTITAEFSRAHWLISGQTHEFIICAVRQMDKQMDVLLPCVCSVIDNKFRHNIVKVAVDSRGDSRVNPQMHVNLLNDIAGLVITLSLK